MFDFRSFTVRVCVCVCLLLVRRREERRRARERERGGGRVPQYRIFFFSEVGKYVLYVFQFTIIIISNVYWANFCCSCLCRGEQDTTILRTGHNYFFKKIPLVL